MALWRNEGEEGAAIVVGCGIAGFIRGDDEEIVGSARNQISKSHGVIGGQFHVCDGQE